MKPRAVILARVSDERQLVGQSLSIQFNQARALIEEQGWEEANVFPFVESSVQGEREYFHEILNYCKDPKNNISWLIFLEMSRFTRQGQKAYLDFKYDLEAHGVKIKDLEGVISYHEIDTMKGTGFTYSWSTYRPSETEEIKKADEAQANRRVMLTKLITVEILYTQQGYWNKRPPYGYRNQKVETPNDGERNILVANEIEAPLLRKMFQMRIDGKTDQEIVDAVNELGFKTRIQKKRRKFDRKVIGQIGGNALTVKHLQRMLKVVAYAGIICEKWTHNSPVQAKFPGLVSVEQFNSANANKIKIVYENGLPIILKGKAIRRRNKNNPLFPFKHVVLCPLCKHTLKGSSSTNGKGRTQKKYDNYHCSRKEHKYWRVSRKDLHIAVYDLIHKIKFNDDFSQVYMDETLATVRQSRQTTIEDIEKAQNIVNEIQYKKKELRETINLCKSPLLLRDYESDYEELVTKLELAQSARNKLEVKEIGNERQVKLARYFMEHLVQLLIDEENPAQQAQLFGLIFDELPTYENLVSGTGLKLSILFELKREYESSKERFVDLRGVEPLTFRM